MESPACVTPKFICNDVIARLAKWRVLATTGACASARTELKRQLFLDIGVTDLCRKMVVEFGKLCSLYFLLLSVYSIGHKTLRGRRSLLQNVTKLLYYVLC